MLTDAEIAGFMDWRGPGAYTAHKMRRVKLAIEEAVSRERDECEKKNELFIRLVSAVTSSEFGGVSCFDIEGHGNWFEVRDMLLRSNVKVRG